MALEKLKIFPEPFPGEPKDDDNPNDDGHIDVMFNPSTYSISKSVSWTESGNDAKTDAPSLSFGGGGARTLSLELFYDVTGDVTGRIDDKTDVRKKTDLIVRLTRLRRDSKRLRPPVCDITWGSAENREDFPFTGVVISLNQKFLLFHESGRPLRATLDVVFKEFLDLKKNQQKTDPELTTRIVRRGDTLAGIAADAYSDPSAWRLIAQANRIENPFDLPPGMKLTLPKR